MSTNVGTESQKTHATKYLTGFYQKYMHGNGLDIGYAGYIPGAQPILPTAIGIDMGYPGYDGKTLPFKNESQDYVYTSHTLEHISDYKQAINEWFRVLKIKGHLVIVVPHQYLYEKCTSLPSRWNADHKRFYTPSSLLKEIEESLLPNTYRIRLLTDGDHGFDYSIPPDTHSGGQYEITLVLEKIQKPTWDLE
jgi:SAM-dependent methyltransferase